MGTTLNDKSNADLNRLGWVFAGLELTVLFIGLAFAWSAWQTRRKYRQSIARKRLQPNIATERTAFGESA